MRQMPNRTVRSVHFKDFSGAEFERLVFAYHVRVGWSDLAWYGQTGSDPKPFVHGFCRAVLSKR